MTKKPKWYESDFAKEIVVISTIIGGLAGIVAFLQYIGTIDILTPLQDALNQMVPFTYLLYTVASFCLVICVYGILSNYFDSKKGLTLLNNGCVRLVAELCQNPQSLEFIREQYESYYQKNRKAKYSKPEYCLQAMDKRGLIQYDSGKRCWIATQKSLDYLEKFYGLIRN